jgi:hypothetical protein
MNSKVDGFTVPPEGRFVVLNGIATGGCSTDNGGWSTIKDDSLLTKIWNLSNSPPPSL